LQTIACLHKLCDLALEAGKLREVLKDTEEIAQTLWSSIHGTVSIHLACNGLPWIELPAFSIGNSTFSWRAF